MLDKINGWLDGKKTALAGSVALLGAISGFLVLLQNGLQVNDLVVLVKSLASSLMIFGFGGKLQKLIDALKSK